MSKRKNIILCGIIILYFLLIIWIFLLKATVSFDYPRIISVRGINLIPFFDNNRFFIFTIRRLGYIRLMSVMAYSPMGLFVSELLKNRRIIISVLLATLLSVFIEIIQWIFSVGICDINSMICGFIGALIGSLVFFIIRKKYKGQSVDAVNLIGIVVVDIGILEFARRMCYFNILFAIIPLFCVLVLTISFIINEIKEKRRNEKTREET